MRISTVAFVVLSSLGILLVGCTNQPAPAGGDAATTAIAPAAATANQIHGTLLQVMRGIVYPAANVIYSAQDVNPADVKPAEPDPATSPNPLSSAYGQWTAVENAGIAMAEAANLLTIPGRKCSNGKDVPMKNADWPMLVQGLRDAGMASYKAGVSKNQDNVLAATDAITEACAACHDKYRDVPDPANRCM